MHFHVYYNIPVNTKKHIRLEKMQTRKKMQKAQGILTQETGNDPKDNSQVIKVIGLHMRNIWYVRIMAWKA